MRSATTGIAASVQPLRYFKTEVYWIFVRSGNAAIVMLFPRRRTIIAFFGAGSVFVAAQMIYLMHSYNKNMKEDDLVISQVLKCTHDKGGLPVDYLEKGRNYQDLLNYYKQKAGSEEAGRKLFLHSSACADPHSPNS